MHPSVCLRSTRTTDARRLQEVRRVLQLRGEVELALSVRELLRLRDRVADQGVHLAQFLLHPVGVAAHQLLGQRDLQLHHVQGVALDVVQVAGEAHSLADHSQLRLPSAGVLQFGYDVVEPLVGEHQTE